MKRLTISQNDIIFTYDNFLDDFIIENQKEIGHLYVYKLNDNKDIESVVGAFSRWEYFLVEEYE